MFIIHYASCYIRHQTCLATSCHTFPLTCQRLWNTFTCKVTASRVLLHQLLKALQTSRASSFGKDTQSIFFIQFFYSYSTIHVTGNCQSLSLHFDYLHELFYLKVVLQHMQERLDLQDAQFTVPVALWKSDQCISFFFFSCPQNMIMRA